MRRYHVNPRTGNPSICRAEKGKCPYGGDTGEKGHYDTFGEAQKASQAYFEKIYDMLPKNTIEQENQIKQELESKRRADPNLVEKLRTGAPYNSTKEIIFSEDKELIAGIINGEILNGTNWELTSAALQSENIPKKTLLDIVYDYPDDYNETTRRWAILNRSLRHEELVSIISNPEEDVSIRALAFRNPNLKKEFVDQIIRNHPDVLDKMPYSMIHYTPYKTSETDYKKDEAMILGLRDASGIRNAESLAMKFVPWNIKYRKEIAEEV